MINIFKVYFFTFISILFLYNVEWSYKYPAVEMKTIGIELLFLLLMLPSYFFIKKLKITKKNVKIEEIEIKKEIILILFLSFVEFIYVKKIPLFEILKNTGYYYKDYTGIPTLHVLLYQFNIYISIIAGYNLVIKNNRSNRIKYCSVILPFILTYSRFGVILSILTSFNIYIFLHRKKIRAKLKRLIIILFTCVYIFGITGNIRNGYNYNDSRMILSVGGATNQFKNSIIPKEFFWTYIYITSSFANFQKTIKETNPSTDVKDFALYTLTPNFISKRFITEDFKSFSLVSQALNGAPDLTFPYVYLGWPGVIIYMILKSIVLNISVLLIIRGNKRLILPNLSFLSCFVFLNFINNFYIYAGIILILFFTLLYSSYYQNLKIRRR